MRNRFLRLPRKIFSAAAAFAAASLLAASLSFGADGDALWGIVSNCIDTGAADYCTTCNSPQAEAACPPRPCSETTQVWAETNDFVAIRDRKMCGCPDGFVHGLALPRSRVTGVEDPARPDGIWDFAWKAAEQKLPENDIALAVNPQSRRSQNQLHVHIVRVRRESLPTDAARTAHIDSLAKVWETAARKAADLNWKDYGVLVTRDAAGKYLVVIDDGSPERDCTLWGCGGDNGAGVPSTP